MYYFSWVQATRVMWTPPLRESFAMPFLILQMLIYVTVLRYGQHSCLIIRRDGIRIQGFCKILFHGHFGQIYKKIWSRNKISHHLVHKRMYSVVTVCGILWATPCMDWSNHVKYERGASINLKEDVWQETCTCTCTITAVVIHIREWSLFMISCVQHSYM